MRSRDINRILSSLAFAGTLVGLAPVSAAAVTRRVDAGAGGFAFDPKTATIARGCSRRVGQRRGAACEHTGGPSRLQELGSSAGSISHTA